MADKLPEMQRQEKLSPALIRGGFSEAMDSFALNSNIIGEFGAKMAQSASNALAIKHGTEMGQNPKGDLLPPITATDKVFADAYHSSAQATLALQANKSFSEAQVQMAQMPRIGQTDINNFTTSMGKMNAGLIDQAPTAIKSSLSHQLGNALISSTKNLQLRMISENRQESKDTASVYSQQTLTNLYASAFDQNTDNETKAESTAITLDDFNKTLDGYAGSGIMTRSQVEGAKNGARLARLSGLVSGEAVKAAHEGRGAEFLSNLDISTIEGANPAEEQQLKLSALNQVKHIENLSVRQENQDTSSMLKNVEKGTDTPGSWEEYKDSVSATRYNQTITKALHFKSKAAKSLQGANQASANWASPGLINSKPSDINTAFHQNVAKILKDNPGMSEPNAMAEAVSTAGAPVPEFVKSINSAIIRGGAGSLNQASQMIDTIHRNNRANLPLTNEAQAILYPYLDAVNAKNENQTDQEVLDQIKHQVTNQSEDTLKALDSSYKSYTKSNFGTDSKKLSFARDLFDLAGTSVLQSDVSARSKALELFEHNYKLFRGDAELAKKQTREQLSQSYGNSKINGSDEAGYMMPNNVAKLPDESTPIIQHQINRNLEAQLKVNNDAFDANKAHALFKYTVVPAVNFDEAMSAKVELQTLMTSPKSHKTSGSKVPFLQRVQELQQTIAKFQGSEPATIIKTDHQGREEKLKLYTSADSLIAIDGANANQHVGNWHLSMRSESGAPVEFTGIGTLAVQGARYEMDLAELQKNTADYLGITPSEGQSYKQAVAAWIKERDEDPGIISKILSSEAFKPGLTL